MKPEQRLKTAVPLQVNNIRLGIPVRVIRKNNDKGSEIGCVYIYDGLYDVVRLSAEGTSSCLPEACLPATPPGWPLSALAAACSMRIVQEIGLQAQPQWPL